MRKAVPMVVWAGIASASAFATPGNGISDPSFGRARCAVHPGTVKLAGTLTNPRLGIPGRPGVSGLPANVENGVLWVPAEFGREKWTLSLPGYVPVTVTLFWDGNGNWTCPPITLRSAARVEGDVSGGLPGTEPVVQSTCAVSVIGREFELDAQPSAFCEVWATQMDGRGVIASKRAQVVPKMGAVESIHLVLPSPPYGGLGVSSAQQITGLEVLEVFEDSAAQKLGLRPGDLIIEINGEVCGASSLGRGRLDLYGPNDVPVEIKVQSRDGPVRVLEYRRSAFRKL